MICEQYLRSFHIKCNVLFLFSSRGRFFKNVFNLKIKGEMYMTILLLLLEIDI